MAMVGLTGRKLAWCNVGDASIQLSRRAPGEGRLRCVFLTVEQHSSVRTASGQEFQMPLQLGCYSHADQTVEHAVKSMEGAYFGIMTPEWEGFVLFCCCFVSRWATYLLCDRGRRQLAVNAVAGLPQGTRCDVSACPSRRRTQ